MSLDPLGGGCKNRDLQGNDNKRTPNRNIMGEAHIMEERNKDARKDERGTRNESSEREGPCNLFMPYTVSKRL